MEMEADAAPEKALGSYVTLNRTNDARTGVRQGGREGTSEDDTIVKEKGRRSLGINFWATGFWSLLLFFVTKRIEHLLTLEGTP